MNQIYNKLWVVIIQKIDSDIDKIYRICKCIRLGIIYTKIKVNPKFNKPYLWVAGEPINKKH